MDATPATTPAAAEKKPGELYPKPPADGRVVRYTETRIGKDDVATRERLKADGWKYSAGSRSWYKVGHHPDAPGDLTHHLVASPRKNVGVGQAAWDEHNAAVAEVDAYADEHAKPLRRAGTHDVRPTIATDGRYAGTPLIDSRYTVRAKGGAA